MFEVENPLVVKGWKKTWAENNKDSIKKARQNWEKNNPDKIRSINHAKRARRKSAEGFFTKEDIKKIIYKQKHKCAICFKPVRKNYHVDHIIPLAKNGTNWPENLQVTCPTCNMSKGAKCPIEFAQENGRLL